MKAPKIGVCGSHCVGKSTLVHALGRSLDLPIVEEVVRNCPHPVNEHGNIVAQTWILAEQVAQEMKNFLTGTVTDRTSIDVIGYAKYLTDNGRIKEEDYFRLMRAAYAWGITYDAILYVPIEVPLTGDGFRSTNAEYQKAVDQNIVNILSFGLYRYTAITGNHAERAEKALKYLDSIEVI